MVNKIKRKYYNVGIAYLNRKVYGVAAYMYAPMYVFNELEVEVPEFVDFNKEYPELNNIELGFHLYSDAKAVIEYTSIFEAAYKKVYDISLENKDWNFLKHLEDKENWILISSEDYLS